METCLEFIEKKQKQFDKNRIIKVKDIGRKGNHFWYREAWTFLPQSNLSEKVFVIERLRKESYDGNLAHEDSWKKGDIEYRIGYFIVGKIGRTQGKWIWGQFCPLIPASDLKLLLEKATKEGVLTYTNLSGNLVSLQEKIIAAGNDWIQKNKGKENFFTSNAEAEKLIWSDPLAFVLAVLYDQGIKAERAWEIPYILKTKLGYFDVKSIANTDEKYLIDLFNQKPKLHRFPETMAKRTINACKLIMSKYAGDPKNIWNDKPKSSVIQNRFEEFNGIGQKKASMATNILVRDFGVEVKDKSGIDISYDIHIRRVLLRTGIVDKDDMQSIVNKARELNPDYPGVLDLGSWIIGRDFCHPNNPNCLDCPLGESCAKLINKGTDIKA